MEPKELVEYLTEKLKRNVEMVPPKKEEEKKEKEGGGEKKEKKEDGGGEKKVDGGDQAKVEVNKMEYQYPMQAPMYWYNEGVGQSSNYGMDQFHQAGYGHYDQRYVEPGYMMNQGGGGGYPVQAPQVPFYMNPSHPPPQMFSDENPNACSVM